MRALCLVTVLACVDLVATAAPAQTAPAGASSQADRVFREGRAAASAGDYATARAKFLESEHLEPAPGTLLNIADSEVHLGLLVAAREHFQLAASGFPRGDSRRTWATGQADQLGKRIAHLTLRLDPAAPAGTTITRGGAVVDAAALGHAVDTDPGTVEIVVDAPGRARRSIPLTLADGQSLEQVVSPGDALPSPDAAPASPPPAAESPAPTAPATTTEHPLRPLGFIVGGVGAAGLVVGAITGIVALDKASTMKSHCNTSTWVCDGQGVDAASTGGTLATVSDVSFIAGALLVGAAAYMVLSTREVPTTALVPYADPHGGGAAFVHAF
jgi:hypothetical protein